MGAKTYTRDGLLKSDSTGTQAVIARLASPTTGGGSNTWTKIPLSTAVTDPFMFLDSANGRLKIPIGRDGYYNLVAHASWQGAQQSAGRWMDLRHYNSVGTQVNNRVNNLGSVATAGGEQHQVPINAEFCRAGDYFEIWVYSTNATAENVNVWLDATMVGSMVGYVPASTRMFNLAATGATGGLGGAFQDVPGLSQTIPNISPSDIVILDASVRVSVVGGVEHQVFWTVTDPNAVTTNFSTYRGGTLTSGMVPVSYAYQPVLSGSYTFKIQAAAPGGSTGTAGSNGGSHARIVVKPLGA